VVPTSGGHAVSTIAQTAEERAWRGRTGFEQATWRPYPRSTRPRYDDESPAMCVDGAVHRLSTARVVDDV
jgi:hypothetical protein